MFCFCAIGNPQLGNFTTNLGCGRFSTILRQWNYVDDVVGLRSYDLSCMGSASPIATPGDASQNTRCPVPGAFAVVRRCFYSRRNTPRLGVCPFHAHTRSSEVRGVALYRFERPTASGIWWEACFRRARKIRKASSKLETKRYHRRGNIILSFSPARLGG